MKRKFVSLFMAVALLISLMPTGTAFAEEDNPYKSSIVLAVDSSDCYINGEKGKISDAVPTVVNGRTLVPARFLSESLGGTASWDGETKTATLNCNGKKIEVPIGKDYIIVNGIKNQLDVNSAVIQDRTMLPLRGICEAVGKDVDYYDGLIVVHDGIEDSEKNKNMRERLHKSLMSGKTYLGGVNGIEFSDTTQIRVTEVDVPYYSGELSTISGIYIDDVSIIEKNEENYTLSFDAYNPHYTYGIVEVYDKEGNLKSYHRIDPYAGLGSGIVDYATSVWEILKGLYYSAKEDDLNHFTVKNDAMTENTKITCTVPRDGSVLVTANSVKSERLAAYNTVYALMRLGTTAKNIIPGEDNNDIIEDLEEASIDEAVDMIFESGTAGAELISNFKKATECNIDAFNMKESVTNMFQTFLNYCDGNPDAMQLVLDILDAKDLTVGMVESAGMSAIKTLVPVISMPLDFWETSDAISVLTCVLMDINSCYNARSAEFTFEDTVRYFYEDWEEKNFDTWKDIGNKTNLEWDLIDSRYDINTKVKTILGTYEGSLDDFYVDINGDGTKEKISICKESGIGLNGYTDLYVYINGKEVLCFGGGSSGNPNIRYLATCDLNIEDGCGELIVGCCTGEGFDQIGIVRYSNGGSAPIVWYGVYNNRYSDVYGLQTGIDFDTLRLSSYGDGTFSFRYITHTTSKRKTVSKEHIEKYKETAMWSRKMDPISE